MTRCCALRLRRPAGATRSQIIDGTSVPKAGKTAKKQSNLWRVHSAFDLPSERFSYFELTDEKEGETLDRIPIVKGEIRLGDRAYLQPDRIARVLKAGADVLVRGKWKGARWRDKKGQPIDFLAMLRAAKKWPQRSADLVERKAGANLALRLVAIRKPEKAAAQARRKARRDAQREGYQVSKGTLDAADWVILLTSLPPDDFSTEDILDLYRLRWRIELGFKRLKSLISCSKSHQVSTNVPPDPTFWLICSSFCLLEPLVDEHDVFRARRRLTRPGAWRMLKQLVAILIQAIIPQPDSGTLASMPRLARAQHL